MIWRFRGHDKPLDMRRNETHIEDMTKSSQNSEVPLKDTIISYRNAEESRRAREPILKEAREFDLKLDAFWKKKDAEKQSQK
jgi:hypothetical protein